MVVIVYRAIYGKGIQFKFLSIVCPYFKIGNVEITTGLDIYWDGEKGNFAAIRAERGDDLLEFA